MAFLDTFLSVASSLAFSQELPCIPYCIAKDNQAPTFLKDRNQEEDFIQLKTFDLSLIKGKLKTLACSNS